jgi:hypothetical protein
MSFICSNWVSMLFSFPALMFPIDKDRRGSKWGQHQTFRFYIVWVIFLRFLTRLTVWNFTMTSASVELTWPKGSCGILPWPWHQLSSPDPKVCEEFYHYLSVCWAHLNQRFMLNFAMTSASVDLNLILRIMWEVAITWASVLILILV